MNLLFDLLDGEPGRGAEEVPLLLFDFVICIDHELIAEDQGLVDPFGKGRVDGCLPRWAIDTAGCLQGEHGRKSATTQLQVKIAHFCPGR